MKTQLVESHRARVAAIERGEQKVIGQNVYTEHEPSPLQEGEDGGILSVDPAVEQRQIEAVREWRSERDQAAVERRSPSCARPRPPTRRERHARHAGAPPAGATTGEWAGALREIFGEYRAPTGVGDAAAAPDDEALTELRDRVERVSEALGPPGQDPGRQARPRRPLQRRRADRGPRPRRRHGRGLRGHPPDALAHRRAPRSRRACTWSACRSSPAPTRADPGRAARAREAGADVPVVVGGIIPPADEERAARGRASPASTPRRTSRSRGSWATSSSSSPSITA